MQNGVWDTGRLRCRKYDVVAKAISGKVEEKNLLSLNGLEASWLNTKIHSGIYGEKIDFGRENVTNAERF